MAMGALNLGGKNNRLLVCDLGTHSVKLADVRRTGRTVALRKWAVVPQPTSEDGEIDASESLLIQRLRKAISQNGWRGRDVFCLGSGPSMATHTFVMPRLGAREMPDALRLRLRDAVHFDAAGAYLDYVVGGEAEPGQYRVTAVAAESQLVARARRLMDGAGLRLIGLSSAASVLPHLVDALPNEAEDLTIAVLDVGAKTTVMSFFTQGGLVYSRDIRLGGQAVTDAFMRPIISSDWSITLGAAQAEQVKRQIGIPEADQDIPLEHPAKGRHVLPIIQPVLNNLLGEIRQSVTHFQRAHSGAQLDLVFVGGGGGLFRNLTTVIQNRLGVPVVPVDFEDLIELPERDPSEQGGGPTLSMSAAVGQALNRDDRPNLLVNERKVEQGLRRFKALGGLLTPVAAGVVLMLYWMTAGQVATFRDETAQTRATMVELQQRLVKVAEVNRLGQELAKREKAIREASGRPIDHVGILKELSQIVPGNVTLADVSIDPGRRDGALRLQGLVHAPPERSNAIVGRFIKHLEASPYFQDVHPVSYDDGREGAESKDSPRFQVRCQLIY